MNTAFSQSVVPLIACFGSLFMFASNAEEKPKDKPVGEIKRPRSGDEVVNGKFTVEGRTRNLPTGWSVFFSTQESADRVKKGVVTPSYFHGPVEPNERFEFKNGIGGKPPGKLWIYLYALPPGKDKVIADWKIKSADYIKKFGPVGRPFLDSALFTDAVLLAEMEVVFVETQN